MNYTILQRARLLLEQRRFDAAEKELRRCLAEEPDLADAHSLLALCVSVEKSRLLEATQEAEQAVALEPDSSYPQFVLSHVLFQRRQYEAALKAIHEAILIDPTNATYFGHKASVLMAMEKWQDALESAEQGLQVDPDDLQCINIRSFALERLGRVDEAGATAAEALRRDPDNADSHTSVGWTALSKGDYRKAQEAFREALRLEPDNVFAKSGMLDALRSRYWIYRVSYQASLWLSRFSQANQTRLIIGAWLVNYVLNQLSNSIPALGPLVLPISLVYITFVILSWTARPLFDTILRFNAFGSLLLDRKEIWTSNFVAACVCAAICGGVYAYSVYGLMAAVWTCFYWISLMIVVGATANQPTKERLIGFAVLGATVASIIPISILVSEFTQSSTALVLSMFAFGFGILGIQILSHVAARFQPKL